MKLENIKEVKFNLYNGTRSEFANFVLETPIKSFGYGKDFGSDGKDIWVQIGSDLDEYDDVTDEHSSLFDSLVDLLDQEFSL